MADQHHAEHVPGSMDIRAQEKTFAGFIRVSIWVAGLSIATLIFMGLVNSLTVTALIARLRLLFGLLALLGLAACAQPKWAPQEQVDAARYVEGPPTYITLYTVVNKATGSGAHSAILVNASERVIFDPAGTWYHPKLPERNDVHFGMNDKALAFYIDYHTRKTYDTIEQKLYVSPQVAEMVLERVKNNGAVGKAMCSNATSSILAGLPGLDGLTRTFSPKRLSKEFGKLPGVTTRVITDDDDDNNHGVLLVQHDGTPLE